MKLVNIFILFSILLLIVVKGDSNLFYAQAQSEELINEQIKDLNNDIQDKQLDVKAIQAKQKKFSDAIKQKQSEKVSLNNQLAILDNRMAKAELDIELVETDIDTIKLQIKKTDIEIKNKEKNIALEKEHIENILKLIYKQDNVSDIEILLLNDSLADFLSQIKYLEDVSENIKNSLDDLEQMRKKTEKEKLSLIKQNEDLGNLKKELIEKQTNLDEEKNTKLFVIDQVGKSEREYQRLLQSAKAEQESAAAEIANMEKMVRAKFAQLEGDALNFNDNGFMWPVSKNTITAYFHDPDYPFKNIFEHPAVDIRAGQGSVLKASASGYVARVKFDGSKKYGYIMLVHGDGLSTVYGHVSNVFVKEDEYVVQGQKIGLSGGLPGSPGSGQLTTGAHLHFEVRLNGIPVDPLAYLK